MMQLITRMEQLIPWMLPGISTGEVFLNP